MTPAMRTASGALLVCLWVACASAPEEVTAPRPKVASTRPGLIALEAFFPEASFDNPKLSPDGKKLVALNQVDGVPTLVSLNLETGVIAPITAAGDSLLSDYWWANSERLILSLTDPTGLLHRLSAIDIDGERYEDLSEDSVSISRTEQRPNSQFADTIVSLLPDDPENILVAYPFQFGLKRIASTVFRLNVYNGRLTPEASTRLLALRWFPDATGDISLGFGFRGGDLFFTVRNPTLRSWRRVSSERVDSVSDATLIPLGVAEDPGTAYVKSRHQSDRFELYRYRIESGEFSEPLFRDDRFDVSGPMIYSSPAPGQPARAIGIRYVADFPQVHWLDPAWQAMAATIDATLPDTQNELLSWSRDEQRVLVLAASDTNPGTYYLFDRAERKLVRLFDRFAALDTSKLASVEPISFVARDGVEIFGYLTLPRATAQVDSDASVAADATGASSREASERSRRPVVVLPHGGRTQGRAPSLDDVLDPLSARDDRSFDPEVQFLASRGFAVFQPNYRGSVGYGRKFEALGRRGFGDAIPDDIVDGVRWLIRTGIADPDRICVFGNDSGAFVGLAAVAREPDLFACAAARDGLFDFGSYIDERRVSSSVERQNLDLTTSLFADGGNILLSQVGYGGRDTRVSDSSSLLEAAREIRIPTLLAYGDRNRLVAAAQTERMSAALLSAGGEHSILRLEDQPNFFTDIEAKRRFYRLLEDFLLRYLDPDSASPSSASPDSEAPHSEPPDSASPDSASPDSETPRSAEPLRPEPGASRGPDAG